MKLDLDELERNIKETDERHKHLPAGGEYGWYEANKDDLNDWIYVLYRDGFYLQNIDDYVYAATCINALPILLKRLRELEDHCNTFCKCPTHGASLIHFDGEMP